ncbi:MAG: 2TM domain-containing protein [Acidimicrobiales bacterium]
MWTEEEQHEAALARLAARREFKTHVAVYVIVNLGLVVLWAATGAGYFWPIWVLLGWGIAVALNAWTVYIQRPITEDDIQAEMRRGHPPGAPS